MHSNLFQNDHILSIYTSTDRSVIYHHNERKERKEVDRKRGKISLIRLSNSVSY